MALQELVEQTVQGLGLDLVEIERAAGGVLRITIDLPWLPEHAELPEQFVTIEDCERVSRQLQYVFEVEAVDYHRLNIRKKLNLPRSSNLRTYLEAHL